MRWETGFGDAPGVAAAGAVVEFSGEDSGEVSQVGVAFPDGDLSQPGGLAADGGQAQFTGGGDDGGLGGGVGHGRHGVVVKVA